MIQMQIGLQRVFFLFKSCSFPSQTPNMILFQYQRLTNLHNTPCSNFLYCLDSQDKHQLKVKRRAWAKLTYIHEGSVR